MRYADSQGPDVVHFTIVAYGFCILVLSGCISTPDDPELPQFQLPERARELKAEADELADDRDFTAAAALYAEALQTYPNDPTLSGRLGWALLLSNEAEKSRTPIELAISAQPQNWEWASLRGHAQLALGDSTSALLSYRLMTMIMPEGANAMKLVLDELAMLANLYHLPVDSGAIAEQLNQAFSETKNIRELVAQYEAISEAEAVGAYESALEMVRNARSALLKLDWAPALIVAEFTRQYAGALYNAGDYAEALQASDLALSVAMESLPPESVAIADYIYLKGAILASLGRYAEAADAYEESLRLTRSALGPNHLANAYHLHGLGQALTYQGKYIAAEKALLEGVQIAEPILGEENPEMAYDWDSLAWLYSSMGDYVSSEKYYKKSLQIVENFYGENHTETGLALNNLAVLYRTLGAYDEAKGLIQRSFEIFSAQLDEESIDYAVSMHNLAQTHHEAEEYDKAETIYLKGIELAAITLGRDHSWMAVDYKSLGQLYWDTERWNDARTYFERAREVTESRLGSTHPDTVDAKLLMARFLIDFGETKSAQEILTRMPVLAGEQYSPEQQIDYEFALGQYYASTENLDAAVFWGKQAVNRLQGFRGSLKRLSSSLRKAYASERSQIYKSVASWLIDAGRLAEAQKVLNMLKEDEYFSFIRRSGSVDPRKSAANMTQNEAPWDNRYQAIRSGIISLSREYTQLKQLRNKGLTQPQEARYQLLATNVRMARLEFAEFHEEMRTHFSKEGAERAMQFAEKGIDPDSRARLRGLLNSYGSGVTLLTYLVTEEKLRIILSSADAPALSRDSEISATKLRRLVFNYRGILQDPRREPNSTALELYDMLVRPVAEELDALDTHTIILQLDDTLRYLPFAALHDGEQYLVEKYSLALTTVTALQRDAYPKRNSWRIAGMGVTEATDDFSALPSVKLELQAVIREEDRPDQDGVLPGIIKLDDEFTADELSATLNSGRYNVIHLASHFVFKPGTEQQSYLLLGKGERLSLRDIRFGDFPFFDVDLLTLSGCETGMGGIRADGREIDGFGTLAQNKGAAAVMATLWPVADASTAHLVAQFYELREEQGLGTAKALQKAQQAFLASPVDQQLAQTAQQTGLELSHPFFWAPFIVMGEWR